MADTGVDDSNKIPRPSQELLDKVEEIAKKYVKVKIQEMCRF
jgi:hypothetical protein